MKAIKGSCLCGAVQFEVTPPFSGFRYCYCSRCRKASGSAHAANLFLPEARFAWRRGEALVRHFDLPGAKRFAVSFCGECGSRVPHKIRTREDYLIPAGSLDEDPNARPENGIFWDSRARWYVESHEIAKYPQYPPS
jgi:hypothetical protein